MLIRWPKSRFPIRIICIWQTWINHFCKSGLDPINHKSSFTILFELAPMHESSLLSLLWGQGVTMSVCITLTKSADPNWVCPALLRSCWVYTLGQAEFRIETQPANSYMMVGWWPMWLWCQAQSQLDLWGLGPGFDIILFNHISQQQAGAFFRAWLWLCTIYCGMTWQDFLPKWTMSTNIIVR